MRTWGNGLAAAQAESIALPLLDAKNRADYTSGFYTDNALDGGTAGDIEVPASLRLILDYQPIQTTLTFTLNGVAVSVIDSPLIPGSAGVVSLDWITGALLFHADDLAKVPAAQYKHYGTVYDAHAFNRLQVKVAGASPAGHTHAISDVSGLATALAGKSNTGHTHAISDVTNLQTALDGKQPLHAMLTALAALSATGLVIRTGAGASTTRTITGTTNLIDITNGNGVSGNPTITVGANVARKDQAGTFTAQQIFTGGIALPFREVTGATTITTSDETIYVAIGGSTVAFTLPTTVGATVGRNYKLKINTSAGTINLNVNNAGTELLNPNGSGWTTTYAINCSTTKVVEIAYYGFSGWIVTSF